MDYLSHRRIIRSIVKNTKSVEERIAQLTDKGYNVKRCYVPTYNGLMGESFMPQKKIIRLIIGRPKKNMVREVFAIDFDLLDIVLDI
jgi:hypothetical protein